MAVQRFWLIVGSAALYDVSITYSVRYSYGQPSGLKVTIGGHVEWPSGRGNVSLPLLSPLASVIGMSAPLANASGVVTSFDWSDAGSTYVAAVAPDNSSISWSVGKDFSIDPVTITTSSDWTALVGSQDGNVRRIVYSASRFWLFYTVSGQPGFGYASSTDGASWATGWFTPTLQQGWSFGDAYSFWSVGSTVWYITNGAEGAIGYIFIGSGTLYADGSTSLGNLVPGWQEGSVVTGAYTAVDAYGYQWAFLQVIGSGGQVINTATGASYLLSPAGTGIQANLVPISSGMAVVWTYPGANALYVSTSTNGGSTWSSVVSVSGYAFNATTFKAVSVGNTIYVAASNGSRIYFLSYTLNSASWSGPLDLGPGTQATITVAGQDLIIGYLYNSTTVAFLKSPNYGVAWDSSLVISRTENASITISSPVSVDSGAFAMLAWVSGTSAPYAIRTATFPATVPNAATSASPWSMPGKSPYEYYFSHESEYVSPGNGLLGIEQTDFSLAGRGLNLVFERVYSTPYAFTPSSPYMYENYTAVNMGLGWQLNLPWMGPDYLHLWDGQVYEYNWNGSSFENHVGENFLLVNNTSSYDLYTASGLDYHFDSGKKLVSMTDTTGNNTISFSYDANGKMTTITDTVGRNVTLCYNGSGQLSTLVTPGGNWTYSYSGVDLVSVVDPLGRSTSYQYNTGINAWLPSAVIYPTGGITTYTWGNATVGTEVLTFYVSSQNIEPRNGTISRSTSFSFTVADGKVTFCNSTISDGTNNVTKTQHDFSSSYSVRKEMDASGNVILQYRTYYDDLNRINETDTLSPAGDVLASSTSEYDNWGNTIMTDDADGHQTWFSYANTDSYNTFLGAESTFTNGFYDNNSVISPNIHNALVGEAQLQDGSGSAPIETYYDHNAAGEIINEKQLHVPSGTQGYVQSVGESGSGGPTSTLTVDSIFENGTAVSGYYTILYQNGNAIATGFTPVTFTLSDNQQYVIQVQDYGGYGFDYWADSGSADQTRSISIDSNAALLAVYQPTAVSPPPSGESVI
jgi:YD repeat-containing protein